MDKDIGQNENKRMIKLEAKEIEDQENLKYLKANDTKIMDNEMRYKKRFLDYEKNMTKRMENLQNYIAENESKK